MEQSPCPDRIFDDSGYAFAMGCIGGGIYHGVQGYRNAASYNKWSSIRFNIARKAPALGSSFAIWGVCFSSYDCLLHKVFGRDVPFSAVIAGGLTGVTLSFRHGPKQMAIQGVLGAAMLGLIETMVYGMGRLMPQEDQMDMGPVAPPPTSAINTGFAGATGMPSYAATSTYSQFAKDFEDDQFDSSELGTGTFGVQEEDLL